MQFKEAVDAAKKANTKSALACESDGRVTTYFHNDIFVVNDYKDVVMRGLLRFFCENLDKKSCRLAWTLLLLVNLTECFKSKLFSPEFSQKKRSWSIVLIWVCMATTLSSASFMVTFHHMKMYSHGPSVSRARAALHRAEVRPGHAQLGPVRTHYNQVERLTSTMVRNENLELLDPMD
jgi:hypothetical protein